ncbi:hypothetical protein PF008_g28829 [Phytophthora fragariae]|uniref:Uncharacterized protein n=1 Tax=Phytophthora fragariae TaxID=53985 RepID=A0A6G0QA74_9STRA|nr:hypothetical protein PF008_g28829 [Phytophthora fragariae]
MVLEEVHTDEELVSASIDDARLHGHRLPVCVPHVERPHADDVQHESSNAFYHLYRGRSSCSFSPQHPVGAGHRISGAAVQFHGQSLALHVHGCRRQPIFSQHTRVVVIHSCAVRCCSLLDKPYLGHWSVLRPPYASLLLTPAREPFARVAALLFSSRPLLTIQRGHGRFHVLRVRHCFVLPVFCIRRSPPLGSTLPLLRHPAHIGDSMRVHRFTVVLTGQLRAARHRHIAVDCWGDAFLRFGYCTARLEVIDVRNTRLAAYRSGIAAFLSPQPVAARREAAAFLSFLSLLTVLSGLLVVRRRRPHVAQGRHGGAHRRHVALGSLLVSPRQLIIQIDASCCFHSRHVSVSYHRTSARLHHLFVSAFNLSLSRLTEVPLAHRVRDAQLSRQLRVLTERRVFHSPLVLFVLAGF